MKKFYLILIYLFITQIFNANSQINSYSDSISNTKQKSSKWPFILDAGNSAGFGMGSSQKGNFTFDFYGHASLIGCSLLFGDLGVGQPWANDYEIPHSDYHTVIDTGSFIVGFTGELYLHLHKYVNIFGSFGWVWKTVYTYPVSNVTGWTYKGSKETISDNCYGGGIVIRPVIALAIGISYRTYFGYMLTIGGYFN